MEEKRYIISEAAEKIGIEAHVLRYWEEELGLDIPRNEMGHRYYTENQLQLFRQIKELKDSGFQLKAVKTVLEGSDNLPGDAAATIAVPEGQELAMKRSEDKLAQFEQIISDIVTRSLMANNSRLGEDISSMVTDQVSNKVIKEMDYMMRVREEAEDDRFRRLDETIRGMQRSNKEAAAFRERQAK
ncbi:MAG: MerR family transcriptional regulator [Lachnospiraceae bacterium]